MLSFWFIQSCRAIRGGERKKERKKDPIVLRLRRFPRGKEREKRRKVRINAIRLGGFSVGGGRQGSCVLPLSSTLFDPLANASTWKKGVEEKGRSCRFSYFSDEEDVLVALQRCRRREKARRGYEQFRVPSISLHTTTLKKGEVTNPIGQTVSPSKKQKRRKRRKKGK